MGALIESERAESDDGREKRFLPSAEAAFRRKYRMEGKEPFLRPRDQYLAEDMLQRRQKNIGPCPHGNWKAALPQGHYHGMTLEFSAGAHEFDETRKSGNIYRFRSRMTLPRASLPRTAHERRPRRKISYAHYDNGHR